MSLRIRRYLRLELDTEYRTRLLASGRLSGLEWSMVRDYCGVYLDGIGDSLKPPVQRRLVEEESK